MPSKTTSSSFPLPLLIGLAVLTASGPFAIDMYIPALPQIATELETTSAKVALTLSTVVFGMAFGQLFGGAISDVTGRKPILIGGAVISVLGTIVSAVAPTIGILILSRVIQGLGFGACVAVARSMIPDLAAGAQAAQAFTTLMVIQGVAPVLAPVLGGVLAEPIGWRGIFWVLVVIAAVQLAVAAFFLPETRSKEARGKASIGNTISGYGYAVKFPAFVFFGLTVAFGFGTMFAYISASSFVLQNELGLSVHQYSAIFALNSLGLMAGGFLNNRLLRSYDPITILRSAIMVVVVAAVGLVIVVNVAYSVAAMLPMLFFCVAPTSLILGNATALATDIVRKRAGSGTALLGFVQFLLAGAVAPLVGAGSNQGLTMAIVMLASAILALICAVVAQKIKTTP